MVADLALPSERRLGTNKEREEKRRDVEYKMRELRDQAIEKPAHWK